MSVNWSDLTPEQQNFYREFHCPIVNNVREIPENNQPIPEIRCSPSEMLINAVCDTGDRLVRTINIRLTHDQRNAIIAWIEVNLPDHLDPIIYDNIH
jgi:hypothetical protein